MERIHFITYRDKRVLVADCSDCSPEQLTALIDEVPKHITKEPLSSVLVVSDFSRSTFTKETVEHLKLAAVFDRPHLRKAAWVFTGNLSKTLLESIRTFSAREIPTFASREEALEYLVSE